MIVSESGSRFTLQKFYSKFIFIFFSRNDHNNPRTKTGVSLFTLSTLQQVLQVWSSRSLRHLTKLLKYYVRLILWKFHLFNKNISKILKNYLGRKFSKTSIHYENERQNCFPIYEIILFWLDSNNSKGCTIFNDFYFQLTSLYAENLQKLEMSRNPVSFHMIFSIS